MEVAKSTPSGQQQPVGTDHRTEEIAEYFLALPFDDQMAVLLTAASEIIPRLDDLPRDDFLNQMRQVPAGDGRLGDIHVEEPLKPDQAETREEVLEDWMRQSMGGQKHILMLVAPRVMANLRGPDRSRFLIQLSQILTDVDAGAGAPTIH